MKFKALGLLLFTQLTLSSAFATHDSYLRIKYAAININMESEAFACLNNTIVHDGISTSYEAGAMAVVAGILGPQKIVSNEPGGEGLIDINSLSKTKIVTSSINYDYEKDLLEVNLDFSRMGTKVQDQMESALAYYAIVRSLVFDLNAPAVKINAKGIKVQSALGLSIPESTQYPYNKKSPFLKRIEDALKKNQILVDNCFNY
jgi:hypothetical protein